MQDQLIPFIGQTITRASDDAVLAQLKGLFENTQVVRAGDREARTIYPKGTLIVYVDPANLIQNMVIR